jgi:hypothetical protein
VRTISCAVCIVRGLAQISVAKCSIRVRTRFCDAWIVSVLVHIPINNRFILLRHWCCAARAVTRLAGIHTATCFLYISRRAVVIVASTAMRCPWALKTPELRTACVKNPSNTSKSRPFSSAKAMASSQSARARKSISATRSLPLSAAMLSATPQLVTLLTSAPSLINSCTQSSKPVETAWCKAVNPESSAKSTSAPRRRRCCTRGSWPCAAARSSRQFRSASRRVSSEWRARRV